MENGKGEGESGKVEYESLLDIGSGLVIAKVPLESLREQDINARIMKTEMQQQLTDNIKKRGQLESLPFCALVGDKIEIISGHHRVRSAKDSKVIKDIYVLLDTTGLTKSQIAAKQLAHNAISGFDDQSTLKEIVKLITDVDDMLESYVGQDLIGNSTVELEKLLTPSCDFDWKTVEFTFLPHQIKDLDKLIETIKKVGPDVVGYADKCEYKDFIQALSKYQNVADIKNVGAAIYAMIQSTEKMLDENGYNDADIGWVKLMNIFGGAAIPKESAETIKAAVKKMEDDGAITNKAKWKAIEIWANNYLGGE